MTSQDLKDLILSLSQDVIFNFKGETACINPWNEHKFEVGYGDISKAYNDIDILMSDNIYSGMSLNEISEQIELI